MHVTKTPAKPFCTFVFIKYNRLICKPNFHIAEILGFKYLAIIFTVNNVTP